LFTAGTMERCGQCSVTGQGL